MLEYQDPNKTIGERVNDLLRRMTLQEKMGQINQRLYGWECFTFDQATKEVRLTNNFLDHLDWGRGVGAIYGLFRADPWSRIDYSTGVGLKDAWRVANCVQREVIAHSRFGIPALLTEECPHGHQGLDGVSYPTNIGKGNSFDPELVERSAQLMAKELAVKGINLALVSSLDLAKDPRWGRTEECFGEDPYLSEQMSRAIVRGFQGDLIDHTIPLTTQFAAERRFDQIGVVLKHCIAQGEAQGGHNSGTVILGNREFRDIYVPLISGAQNAAGVMAAYNDIDGVPCHINPELFRQILREENNYQGLVMADGLALDRLDDVFDNKVNSANAALQAGVDIGLWDETYSHVAAGIKAGVIDERLLDEAVGHVLAIKFRLGLFEHPYLSDPTDQIDQIIQESQKCNERLAEESVTLIKNDGILPLDKLTKNIAVIGPSADKLYNLLGDYTAPQTKDMKMHTIFREIKAALPQSRVTYALGCDVRDKNNQSKNLKEAINVAQNADVIILVLGGSSARSFDMEFLKNGAVSSKGINMDSGENVDVSELTLGGAQLILLEKLVQLKKPIIAIMIQGRPYDIRSVLKQTNAVFIGWFPGQMGARALTKLILGQSEPSGRLSISYPRNSAQLPVYYYQRAASKQDDYYDEAGAPLLTFGSGIGYTSFKYRSLHVDREKNRLRVTVTVENIGLRDGILPLLVFAQARGGQVLSHHCLLKAFQRVSLHSKERQTINLNISMDSLKLTNLEQKQELPNTVKIIVGDLISIVSL